MRRQSQALPRAAALPLLLLTIWAVLLTPQPAAASDIRVTIDEARLLRLARQGAEVIVGNPSVADVSVQSGRLLVITGKTFGATNVIVLDSGGREIINRKVNVGQGSQNIVVLQRGTHRKSMHCAPDCESTLMPSDNAEFVSNLAKSIGNKFGVARSALEGTDTTGQ